jgi:hypothetical protein
LCEPSFGNFTLEGVITPPGLRHLPGLDGVRQPRARAGALIGCSGGDW